MWREQSASIGDTVRVGRVGFDGTMTQHIGVVIDRENGKLKIDLGDRIIFMEDSQFHDVWIKI